MAETELLMNESWSLEFGDRSLDVSVTSTHGRDTAVVAITETGGIGSVFDASPLGVECYLGTRGDGVSEAFARALVSVIGTQQILLTLALRELSPELVSALLSSVRDHTTVNRT